MWAGHCFSDWSLTKGSGVKIKGLDQMVPTSHLQVSCLSRNSATHDSHDTATASQLPLKKLCYAWITWHNLRKLVASQEISATHGLTWHSLCKLVASQEILLCMTHKTQLMPVSCISRNSATHDSHDTVNASQLPLSLKKLCYAWITWHNLRKLVASQEILLRMTRMTQAYASQLPLKKFCYAWLTSHSLRKLVASQESLLRMGSQVTSILLFAYCKPCAVKCCINCLITYGELHRLSILQKKGFNKKEIRRRKLNTQLEING